MSHFPAKSKVWISPLQRSVFCVSMALSLAVSSLAPVALAGPGDVNSVNTDPNIADGTYYNTQGDMTQFINGSSLTIGPGVTVRGVEVSNPSDPTNSLTGNGGYLYFKAPLIRFDGTADVRPTQVTGNGGIIQAVADYFIQNGNIYAGNGIFQLDVGSATFTPNSRTEAFGGVVTVCAKNNVDIQVGAVIDTSGKVIGTYDSNVINIESGGLVNVEGLLRADGVEVAGVESEGGLIRLIAKGQSDPTAENLLVSAPEAARNSALTAAHNGDVVIGDQANISANGSKGSNGSEAGDGGTILMSATSDIENHGYVHANGGHGSIGLNWAATDGGNGGTVGMTALNNVINDGTISVNGGNGAQSYNEALAMNADNSYQIDPSSPELATVATSTERGSNGGDGGLVAIGYGGVMDNTNGAIYAAGGNGGKGAKAVAFDSDPKGAGVNAWAAAEAYGSQGGDGGHGGLIVFSGPANPINTNGVINANGGNGGEGGDAYAFAWATAFDVPFNPHDPTAYAYTNAVAGKGGNGGVHGLIVVENPGAISTPGYVAHDGAAGGYGYAQALSDAIGTDGTTAIALAKGGPGSTSRARAFEVDRNGDFSGVTNVYELHKAMGIHYTIGDKSSGIFSKTNTEIVNAIKNPALGSASYDVTVSTAANGSGPIANNDGEGHTALAHSGLNVVANPVAPTTNYYDETNVTESLRNGNNWIVLSKDRYSIPVANFWTTTGILGAAKTRYNTSDQYGTSNGLADVYSDIFNGKIQNFTWFNPVGADVIVDSPVYGQFNTLNIVNGGDILGGPVHRTLSSTPIGIPASGWTGKECCNFNNQYTSHVFWIGGVNGGGNGGGGNPGGGGVPGGPTFTPNGNDVFDITKLFSEYRFNNPIQEPQPIGPILVGFQQPSMFRLAAYSSVTDEILALALEEYNRQLSLGKPAGVAALETKKYLAQAGVDSEAATYILEEAELGNVTLNELIASLLTEMSKQTGDSANL
ncbi:MAG: hypothetical protein AB7P76_02240 [Candidatus Melainabacteria bacterium]